MPERRRAISTSRSASGATCSRSEAVYAEDSRGVQVNEGAARPLPLSDRRRRRDHDQSGRSRPVAPAVSKAMEMAGVAEATRVRRGRVVRQDPSADVGREQFAAGACTHDSEAGTGGVHASARDRERVDERAIPGGAWRHIPRPPPCGAGAVPRPSRVHPLAARAEMVIRRSTAARVSAGLGRIPLSRPPRRPPREIHGHEVR